MSAITFVELEFGLSVYSNPQRERQNLDAVIEFFEVCLFDAATRERKSDHLNKLIGVHAIALGVTLVTNNESDFATYKNLTVETCKDFISR
ncbi:hypothetical protein REG_0188 [Candidatus Regiella insecticola LSR1]|uniref:PIN domain-containing protein n=1 Tax=Candidatus Regiella insecticola LSR1 TaxID=663321 RepID=E0WQL7_9ENTR|nr:hypothetical protein REG_0188 [Candidatus Regiella insecticola LSR1]